MNHDTAPRYAISYQRISSVKQREGSGLERQDKAAKRWAEDNGYVLMSGDWVDSGLSGWTGENRTVGALSKVIDGISNGDIPKGTALLIEQWDRLSRQHRKQALRLIEDMLDDGLIIVTLNDGQVWTAEAYDDDISLPIRLMLSLEQAHKFSENLSRRLSAAWYRNTEKVREGSRKRSKQSPSWLKLEGSLDDGRFTVIEDKAAVVREVLSRVANGEPYNSIANDLRTRGVPLLSGKSCDWRSANVLKLARSKAPYGVLELGKGRKNDRVLTGEIINNYFPRIVDEDTQRRVHLRTSKKPQSGPIAGHKVNPTKAILTGIGFFDGRRVVRNVDGKGVPVYTTQVTRKYVGKQSYVERRFLEGYHEIVAASEAEITPEIMNLEVAELSIQDMIEGAPSDRVRAALMADLEETRAALREARRAAVWSSEGLPETRKELLEMEPHEINEVLKRHIKSVKIRKGVAEIPKMGAPIAFDVHFHNGISIDFGDFIASEWED